jgi:hypothetical protein
MDCIQRGDSRKLRKNVHSERSEPFRFISTLLYIPAFSWIIGFFIRVFVKFLLGKPFLENHFYQFKAFDIILSILIIIYFIRESCRAIPYLRKKISLSLMLLASIFLVSFPLLRIFLYLPVLLIASTLFYAVKILGSVEDRGNLRSSMLRLPGILLVPAALVSMVAGVRGGISGAFGALFFLSPFIAAFLIPLILLPDFFILNIAIKLKLIRDRKSISQLMYLLAFLLLIAVLPSAIFLPRFLFPIILSIALLVPLQGDQGEFRTLKEYSVLINLSMIPSLAVSAYTLNLLLLTPLW